MASKKEEQGKEVKSSLFEELYAMIEDSQNNSGTWRDKTNDYYKLRIRDKKTKNFPFPGCSNLRLPTIETYIRKSKANLLGLYSNVKPRCQVVPQTDQNLDKAFKIEKFLDWLCDEKINLFGKLVVGTDIMLERGFSLMKVIWRMEEENYTEKISLDDLSLEEVQAVYSINTSDEMLAQMIIQKYDVDMSETVQADNMEAVQKAIADIRAGKTEIEMKLKDETYNAPDVIPIDPLFIYVPTDAGIDVQKLRFIGHEYYEPFNDLKIKSRNGIIDKTPVDEIEFIKEESFQEDKITMHTKDMKEGIDRINNPSQLVKIIDLYCYYDLDDDGIDEKCHFLLAPDFKKVLKKQRFENDNQKFPFVRFNTEILYDRWYSSRGFPEHLEDISKEVDAQHNQKIDSQTIRNAPVFVFRSGIINPRLVKFIPGQGIPVPGTTPLADAISLMNNNNPNVEFSYEREELLLKTVIQEYLGQMDYSVQSMINKRQPRTLGEVQMQAQSANAVFSLDASLYANSLSQLFTMILDLCQQYMPERIYALVVGENGYEPIHMTRDEIQGRYSLVVRGNDINSNPQLRAQKALAKVQILLSPVPIQTGVVNPLNVFNILKNYLISDGELAWQQMISQPMPPPQPPPGADVQPKFDDLTDSEQAQVLLGRGIRPDVRGRALKSSAMIQEKTAEQKNMQAETMTKILKTIGELNAQEESDQKQSSE